MPTGPALRAGAKLRPSHGVTAPAQAVANKRRETARDKAEQTAEQPHRETDEADAEKGEALAERLAGEPLKVFRF